MDFIDKIASYKPVPAGGAAVANSFCLAVALIYKVILFETERILDSSQMSSNLPAIKKEIEKLLRDAQRLVEEDSEAYLNFVKSRRDDNRTMMTQHFTAILEISMNIMEKSGIAFEWICQLQKIVPPQMKTHLLVASELLMGAINGTVHVARENIGSIRVPEKKENYLTRLHELHHNYRNIYTELIKGFSIEAQNDIPIN